MGVANDKKVIKEAKNVLVSSISNLFESTRERKYTYSQRAKPLSRKVYCRRNKMNAGTVSHIETGRFLNLSLPQLRVYLASIRGRDDSTFLDEFGKIHAGLKAIDKVLKIF